MLCIAAPAERDVRGDRVSGRSQVTISLRELTTRTRMPRAAGGQAPTEEKKTNNKSAESESGSGRPTENKCSTHPSKYSPYPEPPSTPAQATEWMKNWSTLGFDKSMATSATMATTNTPTNERDMEEYSSRALDAGETGGIGKKKRTGERKRGIWTVKLGNVTTYVA